MDAVYIYRDRPAGQELRWSLRGLAENLPHDRVWISGDVPEWVRNVGTIPLRQDGSKHANAIRNLEAALGHPEVSDPFMLFNDDHFIVSKIKSLPLAHWGTMDKVIRRQGPSRLGENHYESLVYTRDRIAIMGYTDPLCYNLHIPYVIHKDTYREAFSRLYTPEPPAGIWPQPINLHQALRGAQGEHWPADVKMYKVSDRLDDYLLASPVVSTSDTAWRGWPGRYVRALLATPSQYEQVDSGGLALGVPPLLEKADKRFSLGTTKILVRRHLRATNSLPGQS